MRKLLLLIALFLGSLPAFAISQPINNLVSQQTYRWRTDDAGANDYYWSAADNTPITINPRSGQKLRLRIAYYVGSFRIGPLFAPLSNGIQWSFNGGPFVDFDASGPFIMSQSSYVTSGTPTTPILASLPNFSAGTFVDRSNVGGSTIVLYNNLMEASTEMEWIIETGPSTQEGTYRFKMTSLAGGGNNYDVTTFATLVVATPIFAGSPYCANTGTATLSNPIDGWYSSDAGLSIDILTGDVNLAASTAGTHTVTGNFYAQPPATTSIQISIRPQLASPTAGVNSVPNQVLCAGSSTQAVGFTGALTGLGYGWTASNPAIGVPASGTGNLASFTAVNGGSTALSSQIKVSATGGTGCNFKPVVFNITASPLPTVNQVAAQGYCSSQLASATTLTGPVAATNYIWTSSSTVTGLTQRKGTNTVPAFTTSANSNSSTTITVIPNGPNHCVGAPMTYQIAIGNCRTAPGNNSPNGSLDIVASPNPARAGVHISYTGDATQLNVLVRDNFGNIVVPVRRIASTNISVDLSTLRPGSYSIQVSDPRTGEQATRTIVKL